MKKKKELEKKVTKTTYIFCDTYKLVCSGTQLGVKENCIDWGFATGKTGGFVLHRIGK